MSRVFLALFLVASLVSGVLFFTPNYSAEYDEEYYEYQPFLQYDFNLHELDLKNYDENDTEEFSGHVYMRREYSNEESETFRKLLVKNYQLFVFAKIMDKLQQWLQVLIILRVILSLL